MSAPTSGRVDMDAIAAWIRDATGQNIVHVADFLPGATTATIVPLVIAAVDGTPTPIVVKVYDLGIDGVGAADVERDAVAMTAAAEAGVAAPRLIDADPLGHRLRCPAIAMTRLHGAPRAHGGSDPDGWVDGLADTLIAIAAAPNPTTPLPTYAHWFSLPAPAPVWVDDAGAWAELNDTLAGGLDPSPARFMHRDFHPLNVLWDDDGPTGSVDWVNGCRGPIEADIATCRINIALADRRHDGQRHAERFLDRCLDAGLPWDPRWDLEFLAGIDRPDQVLAGITLGADQTSASVRTSLRASLDIALRACE